MKRRITTAALGLSFFAAASAFAAEGYVTVNADLYSGPDTSYPSVAMLSGGSAVVIEGCVDGWSWCDVSSGDNRGWVDGSYLQEEYQGQRVLVPAYGVQIGIPIVSFTFGSYWDDHYRNRSWYSNREHWSQVRPRYVSVGVRNDSHGNQHGDSHGAQTPNAHAAPVAATAASEHGRPPAATPPHPVAGTEARPAKPAEHAAEPRTATPPHPVAQTPKPMEHEAPPRPTEHAAPPPKVVAEHKPPAPPKAAPPKPKPEPEKAAPEHDGGKDKDQH